MELRYGETGPKPTKEEKIADLRKKIKRAEASDHYTL
jgi:hypothetical protein